jgi:hypothetical protein
MSFLAAASSSTIFIAARMHSEIENGTFSNGSPSASMQEGSRASFSTCINQSAEVRTASRCSRNSGSRSAFNARSINPAIAFHRRPDLMDHARDELGVCPVGGLNRRPDREQAGKLFSRFSGVAPCSQQKQSDPNQRQQNAHFRPKPGERGLAVALQIRDRQRHERTLAASATGAPARATKLGTAGREAGADLRPDTAD